MQVPSLVLLSWGDAGWGDEIARGLGITLALAICAYSGGLLIGTVGAGAALSRRAFLRRLAGAYGIVFRAVPELVIISLIYFGGGLALRGAASLFGSDRLIEIGPFASGVIALGLVQGAYAAQVIAGAVEAVPKGQKEAAAALGLSSTAATLRVVAPQAARLALPGLANLWMTVLKETALVSAIGLEDLLRAAGLAAAATRQHFLFYTAVVVLYLCVTGLAMLFISRLERTPLAGH